jgi:hypothetical protein
MDFWIFIIFLAVLEPGPGARAALAAKKMSKFQETIPYHPGSGEAITHSSM